MHKSRLVAFGIDCQGADLDTAARFWSAALGRPVKEVEGTYASLEALGAIRLEKVHGWWVMEAPTGQRFCVVKPQRGPLTDDASTWP